MTFRDDRFQELRVPLTWTAAAATAVAAGVALALVLGDRREERLDWIDAPAYGAAQGGFDAATAPVSGVTAAPVRWTGNVFDYVGGYFFAVSENRRLRQRVAGLQRARQEADALRNLNARYAALLKMRIEPPAPSVGAHVIRDVRGPYQNARLTDAGVERGVRIGHPVMTDVGLLGRVVGVTRGASRVLLLTDVSSRTPVMVERTNARAILTGDGSGTPRLDNLRGRNPAKAGDLLLTSGDGGVYPRGLPVGRVTKGLDGEWRAKLFNEQAPMDVARILLFRDFTQGVDRDALAQSVMPPAPPMTPPPTRTFPPAPGIASDPPSVAPATPRTAPATPTAPPADMAPSPNP